MQGAEVGTAIAGGHGNGCFFHGQAIRISDRSLFGLLTGNESVCVFVDSVKNGIDILIAPHHGHKSGFPSALFEITGLVDVVIHSKGSEGNIDGTDVSSQYSENARGILYENLNDKEFYQKYINKKATLVYI